MILQRVIAAVLTLILSAGILPVGLWDDVAFALTFEPACEQYKGDHDRTRVPNYPLSDYMTNNASGDMTTVLKIKKDKACIRSEDIQQKLQYTTDAAKRDRLRRELAESEAAHIDAGNQLRLAEERAERIAKLLASLRALAAAGDVKVMTELTDERSSILTDFEKVYEDEFIKLKKESATQASTIATELKKYNQLSASAKLAKKADLRAKVQAEYASLAANLAAEKQAFQKELMQAYLSSLLAAEEAKYRAEIKKEVTDPAELAKQNEAIAVLMTEKKLRYADQLQGILQSATVDIQTVSKLLEKLVGAVDTSALPAENILSRDTEKIASVLVASLESDDVVKEMDKFVTDKVLFATRERKAKLQGILIQFIQLSRSADVKLLDIFENENKTKEFIILAEKDNLNDLMVALDKESDDMLAKIKDEHEKEVGDVNLEQVMAKNAPLEMGKVCLNDHSLKEADCAIIQELTQLFGGFEDYMVKDFTHNKSLRSQGADLITRSQDSLLALSSEMKTGIELQSSEESMLRFQLLIEVLHGKTTAAVSPSLKDVLSKQKQLRAKILAQAKEKKVFQSCDSLLLSALDDLAGKDAPKNCGELNQDPATDRYRQAASIRREFHGKRAFSAHQTSQSKMVKRSGDNTYYYNEDGNYAIRAGYTGSSIHLLAYFNANKQPVAKLDRSGIVTFFQYDIQNRLIQRAHARFVDSWKSGKFVLPHNTIDRVEFTYRSDTKQISERREYIGQNKTASKTISYRYLDQELRDSSGRKGTYWAEHLDEMRKLERLNSEPQFQALFNLELEKKFSSLVAKVTVKNDAGATKAENYFYYSDLLVLDFIEGHPATGPPRFVQVLQMYNTARDEAVLQEKYKGLNFKGEQIDITNFKTDDFQQLNPILLIDSDGTILQDKKIFTENCEMISWSSFCTVEMVYDTPVYTDGKPGFVATLLEPVIDFIAEKITDMTGLEEEHSQEFAEGAVERTEMYAKFAVGFKLAEQAGITKNIAQAAAEGAESGKLMIKKILESMTPWLTKVFGKKIAKKAAAATVPGLGAGLLILGGAFTIYDVYAVSTGEEANACFEKQPHPVDQSSAWNNCGKFFMDATVTVVGVVDVASAAKVARTSDSLVMDPTGKFVIIKNGTHIPIQTYNQIKASLTPFINNQKILIKSIEDIGDRTKKQFPNVTVLPVVIKNTNRSIEKIFLEYEGDFTRLKDFVRTTIVVSDPKEIPAIIKFLEKEKVFYGNTKHQLAENFMGYSGTITNYNLPGGIKGEIQINTAEMIFAKELEQEAKNFLNEDVYREIKRRFDKAGLEGGKGHTLYEDYRIITDKNSKMAKDLHQQSVDYYSKVREIAGY